MIETIVTGLVAGASAGGALFGLLEHFGKRSFDHKCDEALAKYKEELKRETDKELTRLNDELKKKTEAELARLNSELSHQNEMALASFQHNLELAAAERNFRFSHVFKDTADTIVNTYQKLLALKDATDAYTQPMEPSNDPNRTEQRDNFKKAADDFMQYFRPNKIYIPKATAEKIRILYNTLYRATAQFGMAQAVGKGTTRAPETYGHLFDEFFKSSEQVPVLLEALEDDFQKLLGFQLNSS